MQLGICIIERLQKLHESGFVHRDIKPAQFIFSKGNGLLYLIDFNLSGKIPSRVVRDGRVSHVGNAAFASINSHLTKQQTQRDDLEAAIYVLIYFLKGELPWQKLSYNTKAEMWAKILATKISISVNDLVSGLPSEIGEILSYCRGLKAAELPNYDLIKRLLKNAQRSAIIMSTFPEVDFISLQFPINASKTRFLTTSYDPTVANFCRKKPTRRLPAILDRSILAKAMEFVSN